MVGRRKRANLYQYVAKQPVKSALNEITWREFEMLVGEWFRKQGYTVTETGGVADGGVDIILTKDGETYLVQCKQWKAYKVGVNIVRELLGVMVTQGAAGGYLVTSSASARSSILIFPGTQPGLSNAKAASNASVKRAPKFGSPIYATVIPSKTASIRFSLTVSNQFMGFLAKSPTRLKTYG